MVEVVIVDDVVDVVVVVVVEVVVDVDDVVVVVSEQKLQEKSQSVACGQLGQNRSSHKLLDTGLHVKQSSFAPSQ